MTDQKINNTVPVEAETKATDEKEIKPTPQTITPDSILSAEKFGKL